MRIVHIDGGKFLTGEKRQKITLSFGISILKNFIKRLFSVDYVHMVKLCLM